MLRFYGPGFRREGPIYWAPPFSQNSTSPVSFSLSVMSKPSNNQRNTTHLSFRLVWHQYTRRGGKRPLQNAHDRLHFAPTLLQ